MENKELKLKAKNMQVYHVDYSDFERFVRQVYGVKKYEFVCSEELPNDIYKLYENIDGDLEESDVDELNEFKENGNGSRLCRILLSDLCKNKLIPVGNYLIEVCW